MIKISFAVGLLSVALAVPSQVNAQEVVATQSLESAYGVSPRQLVSMARHGRFKAQGIPSHDSFRSGVRSGNISAEDLIQSAIASRRLSAEAINDLQYLNTVASHLKSGGCGS
ncbi:MAG: hypothetical protein AAFQ80_18480 [Cyanobacteria bacterium J06621_8]